MPVNSQPGVVRNAIHHFVAGLCGVVLGITPPPENREIPFLLALVGAVVVTLGAVTAIAWVLVGAIAGH